MNISGRSIDAFLALKETLSFGAAAKRCSMSPSAFSQLIGRLEQQLGVRLFDRTTRTVALTPEGATFAQGAHRIAAEIQASLFELNEHANRRRGRVTVAATPSLAAGWVPQRLAAFHKLYPGIGLRLHDVSSARCLELVAAGEADIGIDVRRGPELEFDSHVLFAERLRVLCRKSDPLARLDEVQARGLKDRSFIHMARTGDGRQQVMLLLATTQVRDSGLEVSTFGTVAGLVAAGFGIGIVPEHAMQLCSRPELASVPLKGAKTSRPISMVKRRDRSLSVAAATMWEMLKSAV